MHQIKIIKRPSIWDKEPYYTLKIISNMEQNKHITTAEAVQQLSKALKEDKAFWDTYVANIAMCMYDEYVIMFPNTHPAGHGVMIEIFNKGADRFLRLLTAEKSTER